MTLSSRYSIARYLSARIAYMPTFTPDGRQLAFITDITGMPQVWAVDVPDGPDDPRWPDQLTYAPDRVLGAPKFSPAPGDGRLVYGRDAGGNENIQLFLVQPDGTEIALTEDHTDAMHLFHDWDADGTQILYAANRRDRGLFDLYIQTPGEPARMVWQNDAPGYLFTGCFSPDGQRAAIVHIMSSFHSHVVEVELATGQARRLTPDDRQARYGAIAYAPDGRSLFVTTDYGADFLYIARLNCAAGTLTPLVQREWDIEALAASPDGAQLAYAVNVDGASELGLLDVASGETRAAPPIPDGPGMLMDLTFSPDGERLAFTFTSATRTYDIFVWDLPGDRVYPVTRSSHGGIPQAAFHMPELVRYPTFDTTEDGQPRLIPAWFFRPAETSGPAPVIVYVHGGPEGQSRPSFMGLLQYFLHNGYAVLVPNVRGSVGYGTAYSHLDDARKRMDSVTDLAYGARWLRQQPGIDGDRLIVYGGSYGGFMVLAALTHTPDLWAAGVDIVGISSFVTFLENTSDYRRAHREAEYGTLADDREWMESIAPINHVARIVAPLMVIHGANDPRVPLGEAEQLVAALEQRGVPVEFLVFEDEGHGLAKLKNKLAAYPAVIDFLKKHV
ncbi:MAG: S9 family peptidase [Anaerolineae bacterium]|nr:S9 family peptidase [Anaerolineae bacterium]